MTNREYAASLLVEAAGILRDEPQSTTQTVPYITNGPVVCAFKELFTECTQLGIDISDFAGTRVLAEAADNVNSEVPVTTDEVKNAKDEKSIKALVNKIAKWYYKIEPNKKFKILHKVLKVLNKILSVVLVYGGALAGTLKVADKGASAMIVGAMTRSPSTIIAASAGTFLASFVIGVLASVVHNAITYIGTDNTYKYNLADYEKNMSELQNTRKKLVEKKAPDKVIKEYDKAIHELEKAKVTFDYKKTKNTSSGTITKMVDAKYNAKNESASRLSFEMLG